MRILAGMGNRTIYVADEQLWERASALAEQSGVSVSALVSYLLGDLIAAVERAGAEGQALGEAASGMMAEAYENARTRFERVVKAPGN